MNNARCLGICLAAIALLATVGAPARTASANWEGAIANPSTFYARWSYVPDFDQRRALLPNLGRMYCVPTSYMNWMAYIAHHGYPGVNPPGDHTIYYWHSSTPFNAMTGWLYDLGLLMGTHEFDGTKSDDAVNGFNFWMNNKGFSYLIYRYGASENFIPRHGHISDWTLNKCPVVMGVGWYSRSVLPPGFPQHIDLVVREGGHAVSLVEVARSGLNRTIGIRDPASDNSGQPFGLGIQSPATTESYAVVAEQVYLNGVGIRMMDTIDSYGSAILDGYTVIVPLFGLTTVDDRLKLGIYTPNPWNWDPAPQLKEIDLGLSLPVLEARVIPGTPEACVMTPGYLDITGARIPARTYRVDLLTEEVTEIAPFDDATEMIFGRDRRMYIMDGRNLRCINIDADPPVEEASAVIGGDPNAIAYNDADDTVLVHSPGLGRLFAFDQPLSSDSAEFWDLPPDEIVLEGDTLLAVDPAGDTVFMTSQGSQALYVLTLGEGGAVEVAPIMEGSISNPQALSIGDDRTIYIAQDGLLRVYPPDPIDGGWFPDPSSPFWGLAVEGPFELPCSRTNVDPPDPTDPAFFNVLPTEFAQGEVDCIHADGDESGVIDFGDLTITLSNWGDDYTPGTGPGDADANGVVEFNDVTELLSKWLQTCP